MGKFEKRIRKKVKSKVDDFDAWYSRNKDRLQTTQHDFAESEHTDIVILKKKQHALLGASGALFILFVILFSILFARYQANDDNDFLYFADSDLVVNELTITDARELQDQYKFLKLMMNIEGSITRHKESNAIVFARLSSEVEFSDYFICKYNIVLDNRYEYFAEDKYSDLPNSLLIENGTASYRAEGISDIGLYQYTLAININNTKIYMDIQCFDGNIGEFIEQCFI